MQESQDLKRPIAPCQAGCPVNTDTREYVRLIAWGRYEDALEVIRRVNPFPSVCGRICQHPCEENCRRSALDAPIALKELKRFVTEVGAKSEYTPEVVPITREKVAVIGAGPTGMTAAQDLRTRGYEVSVYERSRQAGGMLNIIPKYRLPEHVLQQDIDTIVARGVDVHLNVEIGRDLTLDDLRSQGYKAIIVSTGLSRSRGLALPGFSAQNFVAAIPFMMDVMAGRPVEVGSKALVIGGGNVAADVARTLRRLGAEEVSMACVESREEMPATEEEIAAAVEEGIQLMPSWAPKRVLKSDGRVAGLEMMRVTSVFDENGRFNPQYDDSRLRVVTADMIVLTIGQAGDTSWTRGSGIALDRRGRVAADRELHTTSDADVFLAGEIHCGPGSVVEAMAEGHVVATLVESFLRTGQAQAPPTRDDKLVGEFPDAVRDEVRRIDRSQPPELPAAERMAGFSEYELGFGEAAARREASRCLNCGAGPVIDEDKCASCLTCFRLCPLDGIEIGKKIQTLPEACQACGLCAAECPQGAITLEHWSGEIFREQFAGALRRAGGNAPSAAVVQCVHTVENGNELCARTDDRGQESIHLYVPCVTHLKAIDLLMLVGNGIEKIDLVMCGADSCKHPRSRQRARQVLAAAAERVRKFKSTVEITFSDVEPTYAEEQSA